jgi:2,4-dienoyl-CoA reductase-like NADH-dependent reductase (Old Yellow Enzyme family)
LIKLEEIVERAFRPGEINGMKLDNRFVRSATWEGMATEKGASTKKLIDLLVSLAEGGVGLIISGHAYVSKEGQAGRWQLGMYDDGLIPGLREMTDAVHEKGGKIVAQLAHAGYFAPRKLTGQLPLTPSLVKGSGKSPRKEMTVKDIGHLVGAFSRAAGRAKEVGFDGVQIHSAHGYLLSQFLSPAFNQRQDAYGGSIQNRARIHLEVLRGIREAVGPDYPVLIKMNSEDFVENGLTLEDAVTVGVMLQQGGIDAIELSGGMLISTPNIGPSRAGIKSEEKEAYFREAAVAFKKKVTVPLILVGGNRSLEVAERLLTEGIARYISMSRPFIREPNLVRRWMGGDRRKATCLSDNRCFAPAMAGEGIYCVTEKERLQK